MKEKKEKRLETGFFNNEKQFKPESKKNGIQVKKIRRKRIGVQLKAYITRDGQVAHIKREVKCRVHTIHILDWRGH